MTSHLPSQDAWTQAKNRYIEDLTHEEKQLYLQASPEKIFYDASAAEKSHGAKSTSRGLMDKLQPFVAAIEQYGQALDVYSNAYPLVLSPLWGSIRILLLIAREFGKYFEKLVDMFSRIGDVLPRFQVYERLFPNHDRLVHALSEAYVDIIVFCSDPKAVFRRGQRSSLTSLKVGFKLIWKPFDSQFGQQLDNFRNHRKNVEKEAGLSHMVEAADARALALADHLQLEKTKKEDESRRIIAMITSIDVEAKHRKFQSIRFNGTGEWLLQNDKYLEWKHASSPSSLCCYGILLKQLILGGHIPEEIKPRILRAYKDGQQTPETYELVELVCSLMQLRPLVYILFDGLDECERQPRQDILSFLERLATLAKASVRSFVSCRDEDQLLRLLQSYPRIQLTAAALGSDIKSFVEGSVRSRIESGQLTISNPDLEHQIVRELIHKSQGMFLWIFFQLDDLCEALSDAMIRQTLQDLPVGLVQTYERVLLKISKCPSAKQEIALRVFRWTVCSRRPMKVEELQEAVAFESSDKFWDRDKIPDENLMIETCRGLLVRDEEDRTVRFAHHTVQQYLLSAPAIRAQEGTWFSISPRPEAEAYVGQVCVTYLCFSDFETQIALQTPNVHLEPFGVLKTGGPVRIPTVLGIGKLLLEIPYRILGGKSTTAPLNLDYSKYLTANARTRPQVSSDLIKKYRLLEYIVEYWLDHTQEIDHTLHAKFRHLVMHKTLPFEFRPWGINQHFGPYGCASCPDLTKAKELPFMSLFHYAAQAGHWNLMEGLFTEYCQHEVPPDDTLLIACRHGQVLVVQNLMRRVGFDISHGRAVTVAAAAGHASVLEYFMDPNRITAKNGKYDFIANASSLLNLAATNGHGKVVDTILTYCRWRDSKGSEDSFHINEKDEHTGRTPFFSAVLSRNEDLVRNLLARGAQIRAHGSTAIHIAAEYGHQEILRTLLDTAAKYSASDNGSEMSDFSIESGTTWSFAQIWLRSFDSEGDFPLHKAARNGHSAVVGLILERLPLLEAFAMNRIGIDSESKGGYTALHLAAQAGHLDVLKILKDNGANIGARTYVHKWTALHLAAVEGHEAVVEWLLQNRARSRVQAKDGRNALQLAASAGHDDVVRALLTIHPGDESPFGGYSPGGYSPGEMIALIETAARDGQEAILRAVFECGSLGTSTGKEYLRAALYVAKLEKQNRAADLLRSFFEANPYPEIQFTSTAMRSALPEADK